MNGSVCRAQGINPNLKGLLYTKKALFRYMSSAGAVPEATSVLSEQHPSLRRAFLNRRRKLFVTLPQFAHESSQGLFRCIPMKHSLYQLLNIKLTHHCCSDQRSVALLEQGDASLEVVVVSVSSPRIRFSKISPHLLVG